MEYEGGDDNDRGVDACEFGYERFAARLALVGIFHKVYD